MTIYKEYSHSIERSKQRKNFNAEKAERDIVRAWERGKNASDFNAQRREYLENVESENDVKKAYDGYCYVFTSDGYCKTLYKLPRWFIKPTRYIGNEKIRNVKKHSKYNPKQAKHRDNFVGE